MIRRAVPQDLDGVAELYNAVLRWESQGRVRTGWEGEGGPNRDTARAAGKAGTLYVCIQGGDVACAAVLIPGQPEGFAGVDWSESAKRGEVLTVQDLAVHPVLWRRGTGRSMMAFAEGLAAGKGRSVVRLSVCGENQAARAFFQSAGYRHAGTVGALAYYEKNLIPELEQG